MGSGAVRCGHASEGSQRTAMNGPASHHHNAKPHLSQYGHGLGYGSLTACLQKATRFSKFGSYSCSGGMGGILGRHQHDFRCPLRRSSLWVLRASILSCQGPKTVIVCFAMFLTCRCERMQSPGNVAFALQAPSISSTRQLHGFI